MSIDEQLPATRTDSMKPPEGITQPVRSDTQDARHAAESGREVEKARLRKLLQEDPNAFLAIFVSAAHKAQQHAKAHPHLETPVLSGYMNASEKSK